MRPNIKQLSAEKVFRYFFGENWKNYQIVELAIRNGSNKINIFDDELYVWNKPKNIFKTFNWNADPSAYRISGDAIAILRTGVHFFTISYHHISDNSKRYVALRPNTPGAQLLVWRYDAAGRLTLSVGTAINQHAGGDRTTGSRGCQTAPRSQYGEFITFVGSAFGVSIPLGIQRRAEDKFMKGIGNIPYILITQEQFNYIQNLPESEFDSPEDLRYQMQNFVNVPKVETVKPIVSKNPAAVEVISKLEAEESEVTAENVDEKINDLKINQVENSSAADKSTNSDTATEQTKIQTPQGNAVVTENKNEQDVAQAAEVNEPMPYNGVGFWETIKADLAKVGITNGITQTASEYAQQANTAPSWLIPIITKLAYIVLILGIGYLLFRVIHFLVDSWKQNQRTKMEAEAKTAVNKKDIVWK